MNVHSHPGRTAADRRRAVLDAAAQLFVERGFHGTTVPAIAEQAAVATGTIYRHFEGKEALVNALYRESKRALMSSLIEGFPFDSSPREQVRAFWFRLAEFARESPLAFDFLELNHHADYLDAESMSLEAGALAPFHAFFASEAARAAIKPMPPEALMALVWGMFSGMVRASRLGHLPWSDALVAQAEVACWDALRKQEGN